MFKNIRSVKQACTELAPTNEHVGTALFLSIPLAFHRVDEARQAMRSLYPDWPTDTLESTLLDVADLLNTHKTGTPFRLAAEMTASWLYCGMPSFTLSHKAAAQFMATKVSESVLQDIRTPWKTFLIHVPAGILELPYDDGPAQVTHVIVANPKPNKFGVLALTNKHTMSVGAGTTFVEVLGSRWTTDWEDLERALQGDRAMRMVYNLVAALLVHLEERPGDTKPLGRAKTWNRQPPSARELTKHTFEVRAPVTVDCQPAIKQYLDGTGSSPTVRTLVMGHWKHQVCGTGRTERRRIFIEPYWRGPDDAPVAVRPHHIESTKEKT